MTFANAGTLGVLHGKRDELVAHLTRRSDALAELGCLAYEVGVNDDQPESSAGSGSTSRDHRFATEAVHRRKTTMHLLPQRACCGSRCMVVFSVRRAAGPDCYWKSRDRP